MNDFTKEELMELWENCDVERLQCGIDNYSVLMNKLQSMIDNYCEHDSSGGEVEDFVDTCSKCNAFILRNSHYE